MHTFPYLCEFGDLPKRYRPGSNPWLPVSGHCLARPPHRGIRGVSIRHWLLSIFCLGPLRGGPARLPILVQIILTGLQQANKQSLR